MGYIHICILIKRLFPLISQNKGSTTSTFHVAHSVLLKVTMYFCEFLKLTLNELLILMDLIFVTH